MRFSVSDCGVNWTGGLGSEAPTGAVVVPGNDKKELNSGDWLNKVHFKKLKN